jgi:hypothetical protein
VCISALMCSSKFHSVSFVIHCCFRMREAIGTLMTINGVGVGIMMLPLRVTKTRNLSSLKPNIIVTLLTMMQVRILSAMMMMM